MQRVIWGRKIRLVELNAPDDEDLVRAHPLFLAAGAKLPECSPESIRVAAGYLFVGAFAGYELVALAVASRREKRLLTMVGRLYYHRRLLGRELKKFVYERLSASVCV